MNHRFHVGYHFPLCSGLLVLVMLIIPAYSLPGDSQWDDQFYCGPVGVDGEVNAAAMYGTSLLVGGQFSTAGDATASNIARWDGRRWHAMDKGFNGAVQAIAVQGEDIYVAGSFTLSGTTPVQRIAKWNGSSWSPLGSGLNEVVYALAVDGANIYAGGFFTSAGGQPANFVARWDGSAWHPLGSGVNGTVHALALWQGSLHVGGLFTVNVSTGGSTSNIARFDGNVWLPLDSGINGAVYALKAGQDLYAAGAFTRASAASALRVARWNGTSWSALGGGFSGEVNALAIDGTDIYAGGNFTRSGTASMLRVARWDGSQWMAMGTGADRIVRTLAADNGIVYSGGQFVNAGSVEVKGVARWAGHNWSRSRWAPLGCNAPNDIVSALVDQGGDLYVGGHFTHAGGIPANSVARWDGINWWALGQGIEYYSWFPGAGWIYIMAHDGSRLYVGGEFEKAGGIVSENIAYWDGALWHGMDGGVRSSPAQSPYMGFVEGLALKDGKVYAGGHFDQAGTLTVSSAASWDAGGWSDMAGGVTDGTGTYKPAVFGMIVHGEDIFAGGDFTRAGGIPARNIARWIGNQWQPVGGGNGMQTASFASYDGLLYAAGSFTTSGPQVARWNGSEWSAFTPDFMHKGLGLWSLLFFEGDLFVTGEMTTSDNRDYYIARWTGAGWEGLGSGLNAPGRGALVRGKSIFVGGEFTTAGGKPSSHLGRWSAAPPKATFGLY